MTRALVRNAADPEQVAYGERKEHRLEDLRLAAYGAVLNTPAGRIMLFDLLEKAGTFRTVYAGDALATAHNAGRQDFGHELREKLIDVSEDLFDTMMREAQQRRRRDRLEAEAVATQAASDDVN